ncbi:hypothetical protein H9Y05_15335 [Crocinitomicaceae bacterium CZZ-1]|uniref:Uncharacterized protein n=1 Tax=Taishania pollutisoli TaxID=2766479 RepID=A0A8J6PS82_9FLAO|nr:DUF6495 family protein [Taishania pollutisoli]MBC9813848.1 hypothetical protein [Taishania pollutisoli]MBX2948139.1 hypothetical protein [Crocinitomicaceae bacterium]NGF77362.1 hypothetical protein [Fluviicola sp. SGL-29]
MKFRCLTNEELTVLEDDLKAFLIVNGIDGDEWAKINQNEPEKAMKLVEIFSDSVLQIAYSNIHYVEYRSPKTCIVFHCGDTDTEIISLQLNETAPADLSTPESIHHALVNHAGEIQFIRQSKPNNKTREEEIHQLLDQGCVPSSKEFWVSLEAVTHQN